MKYTRFAAILVSAGLSFAGICATAQAPAEAAATASSQTPLADQPTDAQIAKLFEVMRVKEQLASVTKIMPQLMQQQFNEQMKQMQQAHPEMAKMSPEQQQAFSNIMSKYMQRIMNLTASDDMLSDMAAIYKRHLNAADVEGAIAFYSSPAGQHFLEMVPVMMQELMPTIMHRTQERMKPIIDDMQKELMQIMAPAGTDTSKPAQK
jgi:hypothetical protein